MLIYLKIVGLRVKGCGDILDYYWVFSVCCFFLCVLVLCFYFGIVEINE